jgi:hypothetical protein
MPFELQIAYFDIPVAVRAVLYIRDSGAHQGINYLQGRGACHCMLRCCCYYYRRCFATSVVHFAIYAPIGFEKTASERGPCEKA